MNPNQQPPNANPAGTPQTPQSPQPAPQPVQNPQNLPPQPPQQPQTFSSPRQGQYADNPTPQQQFQPPPDYQAAPTEINLSSSRTQKAKLSLKFKKGLYMLMLLIMAVCGVFAVLMLVLSNQLGYVFMSFALAAMMWAVWYKNDLSKVPIHEPAGRIDDILEPELLAKLEGPLSPQSVWQALTGNWQEIFITNRLLIDPSFVGNSLSSQEAHMPHIWQIALQLRQASNSQELSAGAVATALILSSSQVKDFLTQQKLKDEDVLQCYDWLARLLKYQHNDKPYVPGIGRDWAFGFTPLLERFSTNVSQMVSSGRHHFHFLSRSGLVDAMVNNLSQSGSIAIVGDPGIGKTSAVYALAQRMFVDDNVGGLKDHQVVSLNASVILSSAKDKLEQIMLTLFTEAVHSGNMVIFLDEAQLFFQEGTGSFDLSQILLPVLQNGRIKIIAAFTSTDYQRLKQANSSIVTSFTPVIMKEPNKDQTQKILEDTALGIEAKTGSIISYEAIREAYRLANQYVQEGAFPGKAIRLLDQSASYAQHNTITASSVQQAVENTLGVKVSNAEGQEASALLNLEDQIHQRMINQTEAVKVVSAALRRARAGVGSSKRPIGSFLFLGPTGVGKTELARSLAATYFGDERNMIRLDMSEYQQSSDAGRLLDSGSESNSLILNIRKQPFSVVLMDEIEKAHSSILNLMLQLLDEGQLTDVNGKAANFRNAIIIVTSNAGSRDILSRLGQGQSLAGFERPLIDQLIQQGIFRAELVNRFDEIVLFRSLNHNELMQVAKLMLAEVNKTLSNQNINVELAPQALDALVQAGYDPQFGARPMRRVIQRTVEDAMATRILSGETQPGTTVTLDLPDLNIHSPQTPAQAPLRQNGAYQQAGQQIPAAPRYAQQPQQQYQQPPQQVPAQQQPVPPGQNLPPDQQQ